MRIHTRLVLGFLVALAAPLIAVYAAYVYAADALKAQELERLDATATTQMHRIQAHVDSDLLRVTSMSHHARMRSTTEAYFMSRSAEARARITAELTEIIDKNPSFHNAQVVLPDGETITLAGEHTGALTPSTELVKQARAGPRVGWLRIEDELGLVVPVAAPIPLDGGQPATLILIKRATPILGALRDYSAHFHRTAESLLIDGAPGGKAIVVSQSSRDRAGQSEIRMIDARELRERKLDAPEGTVVTANDEGQPTFVTERTIAKTHWTLVSKIAVHEALAPVRQLRIILLAILGGSLVFALLLASLLARWLSSRIECLTRAARAIRAGEKSMRAEVHSRDEIRELADTFNAMADDLMRASEELETKVQRRTEELTRANDALEHEVAVRTNAEAQLSAARDELEERVRVRTAQLADSEAQLRQAQKMEALGRLAGGVAHDFNNLLTVILGYADAMMRKLAPESALRSYVDELRVAGERAARLTRQLLAFSRQQVVEPAALDLNVVVVEMDSLLRRVIGENIRLVTRTRPEPTPIFADAGQLEQILLNLAVNARDAMPLGGTLTVELTAGPLYQGLETIRLTVTDTGIGMDEPTRQQAVEPFFTTKEESKGTGLGLAMVYGAVRQAGGDLRIHSELGQGTTVEILWPRSSEVPPPRRTPTRGILRRRGSETILLVEDEPAVMRLVQEILEGSGYSVLPAHDGRRALQIAREHQGEINLLLTDVVMPGMGGAALAQQLMSEMPDLPVIYMSGYTRSEVVKERVAHHRADFLAKPVRAGTLLEKVDHVLRRARTIASEPEASDALTKPLHTHEPRDRNGAR